MIEIGDGAYLLKQGNGKKGIFGIGEILDSPYKADDGRMKVLIKFSNFTDPKGAMLISHDKTSKVLQKSMNIQSSGMPMDDSMITQFNDHINGAPFSKLLGSLE